MKSSVRVSGKLFIVVDPFNHRSYTLNNKLSAEQLTGSLNTLYTEINSPDKVPLNFFFMVNLNFANF